MINGGCSNDGFEDFRGWLIVQGHEVFERMIADPDTLADLPIVRAARLGRARLGCEETLYIAYRASEGNGRGVPDARLHHPVPGAGSRMGVRF
jgi:hypothetical protein